jgi:uncharacterized protein YndB with AHSA1/START domain
MVTLVVRKTIRAKAERLFAAWTIPAQLKLWWGPQGVKCIDAEVDLRPGGRYRIANQLPDGKILWITGEFEVIEAPRKLVYTWRVEPETESSERVAVQFDASGDCTEVIVTHEHISSEELRKMHEQGWFGCLESLAEFVEGA